MMSNSNKEFVVGVNQRIIHEKCEYAHSSGYKSYERSGYIGDGYFTTIHGYGWGTTMKPSKLILIVDVNDELREVWVDRYFKDNWGPLTEKRVAAIKKTMPTLALLHENESSKGTRYFIADEYYLAEWLKCAKWYCKTSQNTVDQLDYAIAKALEPLLKSKEVDESGSI